MFYIYKSKKQTTVDVLKLNPTITACLIPYIREERQQYNIEGI